MKTMYDEMSGLPPMMPPDSPPMGPPMGEPEVAEENLPSRATVQKIEGDQVFLKTDDGQEITLPMEAFVFPPEQGAEMVRAEVVRIEKDTMVIAVEGKELEVPVTEGFSQGEFFWMPTPPMGPAEEKPLATEQEVLF